MNIQYLSFIKNMEIGLFYTYNNFQYEILFCIQDLEDSASYKFIKVRDVMMYLTYVLGAGTS